MIHMNKKQVKKFIQHIEENMKGRVPVPIGKYSFFSVLAPLVEIKGELHVLYEVRSDNLTKQPGEVCFPGGSMEPGETPEQCAVRETCEELGIQPDAIRILGQLDTLYAYSNFTMYAFIGIIDGEKLARSIPNEDEVKEIFFVPLQEILEQEPYIYTMDVIPDIREDFPYEKVNFDDGYNWRKGRSEIPIYLYSDWVIWGLTGRITMNMAQIVGAIKEEMEDETKPGTLSDGGDGQ